MLKFSACALLVASFFAASVHARQGGKTRKGSPNLRSPHHHQQRTFPQSLQIAKLQLINADTNNAITDLVDGAVIELSALGMTDPFFNIEAVVSEGNNRVGSVRFALDGNNNYRTENVVPYAFCGDAGGNFYNCRVLALGTHTVTATPFAGRGGSGAAGSPFSVTFTIVSGNTPALTTAPPVPPAPPLITTTLVSIVDTETPTSAPVVVPTSPTPTIGITGFKLIYAPTNEAVLDLENNAIVSLQDLGLPIASFNVMVDTAEGIVKSVNFQQNGRTERAQPFAYCGDNGGNYFACDEFVVGSTNTVTATAFTKEGTALNDVTVSFSIIAGPLSGPEIKVVAPVSTSTKAPTAAPVTTRSPTAAPTKSPTASPLTESPTAAPVTMTAAPVPATPTPITAAPVPVVDTDNYDMPTSAPVVVPTSPTPTTGITGFKLIYAPTNEEVLDLDNNAVVSLQDHGLDADFLQCYGVHYW